MKWLDARIKKAVADYLDRLPDERVSVVVARVLGAQGLTESNVKRLIDAASGDRCIEIHFGNGDMAVISNRAPAQRSGPGW